MSPSPQGTQAGGDERRREARIPTHGEVDAQLAMLVDGKVLDLSPHGMSLQLPYRPPLHSRQEFVLVVGERAVKAAGKVRSVRPLTDTLNAVGVEFDGLSWSDRDAIEAYLQGAKGGGEE